MAFFKYGATVNIKKQASLDIIAKDVPEVSHTADKISAKKDDNFVYFWTRAVSADVPNLNSDLFPLDELKKAYPTFIGRGLYMDHNAQSVANAVGKVFDAKLLEDPTATEEEGRYYVGCLCGVDKTTHPDIAAKVAHGVIDSVSMGASCGSCQCNICNRVCHTPEEFCVHLQHQGQIDPETGKKCISINRDVNFSELSLVGVPADPMAKMQQVFAEFVGGLNKSASLEKEAENSFLEKFSFSIPCGNEKICETLFNVLIGYKKQGISDLSMDGSILKLSVEAKNEDLAKQKLEKISEEQGLGVEQPLEKEENLMPKEEIKPVEEQVEKKAGVVLSAKENDVKNRVGDFKYLATGEDVPAHRLLGDGRITRDDKEYFWEAVQQARKDGRGSELLSDGVITREDGELFNEMVNDAIEKDHAAADVLYHVLTREDGELYTKALNKVIETYGSDASYQLIKDKLVTKEDGELYTKALIKAVEENGELLVENGILTNEEESYYFDLGYNQPDSKEPSQESEKLGENKEEKKAGIVPTEDVTLDNGTTYTVRYNPNEQSILSVMQDGKEVGIDGGTRLQILRKLFHKDEPTIVEEKTAELETKADDTSNLGYYIAPFVDWGGGKYDYDGSSLFDRPEFHHIKTYEEAKQILDGINPEDYAEYSEDGKGLLTFVIYEVDKREMESYPLEDKKTFRVNYPSKKQPDLQEVESSKTQSNEVKEVKAEENKETKKEDLVPGVSKEDTKKAIEHDLAKEKEEAKGGEDETKDIETLEKAIKETDKGALSKVIDLLKKFIGGEAKEGEDLKDYKSDDLVKKLEEKPADKKASIEEPVNNVVNTVAEPVMDHIEAKPEVPAQPVPEVKEEVEEKKEEVKPSKDVKTKEDAVKVLEDVLKAGEEADVKELGKVLDFLKSDKKEEKKDEVKEEKVEEKAETKKEEPVKEEKKAEVEESLEVEAKEEPAKEPEAKCEAEVKEEAKPLFANVTRVSLLKTANLIDSKWVFHFKGTDKVACLSVKNLLPGVSEKVAYLTSKEFYNEMMDTLTKKQAFDGEAVKQIVANYNEKIKVGSDEAKSQVSKATSKAKNETDGKKVSDTSKAVDTKLTDDGKAQKQDKVNSKEDAGAIESATKKAPAETDIKVSAELEAKCKQLTAALEAKEAEVSQMKMQQELAAKTAKARQIVEKSIKCGLVQCNETFRQEELLKQASPLKAKEEAMKRTADSMVADLLALSDEELDKQASYLSNFKVEAEVKQLKPIKIEASCEQSEDEDLIKALGAEMW